MTPAESTPGHSPCFDAAADELYGLEPGDFTRRRDELTAVARSAGDKQAAAAIAKLRKPTVVAWLANMCVRERPEEVSALLRVGDELRRAQAGLAAEEMRALSHRRREAIDALVTQARELARRSGQAFGDTVGRGLEETLSAAVADEAAAAELRSGRLTRALSYGGFGPSFATGAPRDEARAVAAVPTRSEAGGRGAATSRRTEPGRVRLDRELSEARSAASRSDADLQSQRDKVANARSDLEALQAEMGELQEHLENARAAVGLAEKRLRDEERLRRELERAARAAHERVQGAVAALAEAAD